jgi:hypothetical protein
MTRLRPTLPLCLAWAAGMLAACTALAQPDPRTTTASEAGPVPIEPLRQARAAHQATVLADGDVLVTGGCTGGCDRSLRSAERFDAATRRFRPAAAMAIERDSHVAIALDDGRVLVAGGWSQRQASASSELYDPHADRFTGGPALAVGRAAPAAARLSEGRVLVVGGQDTAMAPLASAEIYDPVAGQFTAVAGMSAARVGHVAVALADGRVLVAGGREARRGGILADAELFDPASGRFQSTGSMAVARHKFAAARLPDGRVLVLGGADARDQRGRHRGSELFDPRTGRFSAGPDMAWPRFKLVDAVATLASGAVVVAGGAERIEVFDPQTGRFVALPGTLGEAREFATASVLADGQVLVVGGYDDAIRTLAGAWLVPVPY